jgi:hypothetical protein
MISRRLSRTALTVVIAAAVLSPLSTGAAVAAPVGGGVVASSSAAVSSAAVSARGPLAAKPFANCTALNKKHAHGVGKKGAKDKVSGKTKPVTNFAVSNALYNENKSMDRDKDGVACEKR